MKLRNKILAGLLTINLSLVGAGAIASQTNIAYAASEEQAGQRAELERAVNDVVNVVNSNTYYNYTSQGLKAQYEEAIDNAKLVLADPDASYDALYNALYKINNVKQAIYNETYKYVSSRKAKKDELGRTISKLSAKVEVIEETQRKFPNTYKSVEKELRALLEEAKQNIKSAEALYNRIKI